jgi:hypothetical protein
MKKLPLLLLLVLCPAIIVFAKAATSPPELTLEQLGDKYYAQRNSITKPAEAIANINLAIGAYKNLFEADKTNLSLLYKYGKAFDFKYGFLTGTAEEKKSVYEGFIKDIEPLEHKFSGTKEYNYLMALFWGRRGEYTSDVLEAAKEGVADRIKKYGEALYAADKTFDDYTAGMILGRLHYKSPNIILLLPWPDKNKAKAYIEEVLAAQPYNLEAKMFLADIIWDIGDREAAKKLYREVAGSKPGPKQYYYDSQAIKDTAARMKELQIQQNY